MSKNEDFRGQLDSIQQRLLKVEEQNRRLKQVGIVFLISVASLFLMAQASPSTKAPSKSIEANEFILKDSTGRVRGRLSMKDGGTTPTLVLLDEKGQRRVELETGLGTSGLALRDQNNKERGSFDVMDFDDLGAVLLLQDKNEVPQSRLRETEFWAMKIAAPSFHTLDPEGYEAVLGRTELVTSRTGETHKTSGASLVLFDKNKQVLWRAP